MKSLLLSLAAICCTAVAGAQTRQTPVVATDTLTVEASCGQCRLGLEGKDCDLAVRIDCKAYYVDGTHIDGHGDAHATDGFCNAIRKARVQGSIVDGRFKATYFQLLPEPKQKTKKSKS